MDGSIAEVVVKELNLRVGPSTTTAILKTLPAASRLFVIGDPKVEDDLRWRRVAVIPPEGCSPGCDGLGWVATPATGSDAWIRATSVACPGSPVEAEDLAKLLPLEQLHCYGDREFTVTGWIDTPCCLGVGPFEYSPPWLAYGLAYFRMREGDGGGLSVHFAPDSDAKLPDTTVIMRATAHYDDPASTTCAARIADDIGDGEVDLDSMPTREEMELRCRAQLVITAYEVVGYRPGPGCGCLPPSQEPAA